MHMYVLGGLVFPLYFSNMAGELENHQYRHHLDDLHPIIVFSSDPFKLSYSLAWLIVILVWAGSSWLPVHLDGLRL